MPYTESFTTEQTQEQVRHHDKVRKSKNLRACELAVIEAAERLCRAKVSDLVGAAPYIAELDEALANLKAAKERA